MKPLSPSEIEVGRACLRKWAFKYNSNEPREDSAVSAMAGTALHAIAEAYLTTGATPERHDPFGEMFIEGLPYLPRPGAGVCEGKQHAEIGGLPFVFVQDWYGSSDVLPSAPKGLPATIDHKSSKDPKRYGVWGNAKHLDNPQSLVYLARGAAEASESLGRWLYYQKTTAVLAWELAKYKELGGSDPDVLAKYAKALQTPRKPRAIPSDVILTREEIRGGLERVVLPIGEKLYRLREKGKLDPLTLEPNPAECDAFGGCPHKAKCNLTPNDLMRGYFDMADNTPVAAPSFDLFKKLPPVNGPSAAQVPQAPLPPPQAATPAFVVPTWQPPQSGAAPGTNAETTNVHAGVPHAPAAATAPAIPVVVPVSPVAEVSATDLCAADLRLRQVTLQALRNAAAAFVAAIDSAGL